MEEKKPEQKNDKDKNNQVLTDTELAKKKAAEYLAGWQRAKADYINFKREAEQRQTEVIQFANAAMILEILPIFGHFQQAFKHTPEAIKDSEWVKGIDQIRKQLKDLLKNAGIEEIKTIGEKFNPEFHEAVINEKKDGYEPGIIFEEAKAGYTFNGKVLQPAQVKVAK